MHVDSISLSTAKFELCQNVKSIGDPSNQSSSSPFLLVGGCSVYCLTPRSPVPELSPEVDSLPLAEPAGLVSQLLHEDQLGQGVDRGEAAVCVQQP